MTNTLDFIPIETTIYQAVAKKLEALLDMDEVRVIPTTAELENLEKAGVVKFPVAWMKPGEMSINTEGYPVTQLMRRGLYSATVSSDGRSTLKIGLIPAVFNYEVHFLTTDYNQAYHFASNWIARHVYRARANFRLNYYGTLIDINMEFSQSVSPPEKDGTGTGPQYFDMVGQLAVKGYVMHPSCEGYKRVTLLNPPSIEDVASHRFHILDQGEVPNSMSDLSDYQDFSIEYGHGFSPVLTRFVLTTELPNG